MRVVAAMSGGVDSAVAAARAVEAGHDVVGVHLALSRTAAPEGPASSDTAVVAGGAPAGSRGCCTVADAHDARRAADTLGIPFYVWDLSERFTSDVMADFVTEYTSGRTPNPCVRCNERIKFAALLDRAVALGFDAVCTGHYARLERDDAGRPALHRAADAAKDQSYVLATLPPHRLRYALFPLGDTTKPQVREEAARRGLRVATKPDSHDICFIPDGDTRGWLARRVAPVPGDVVDEAGAVVGTHAGAVGFTVGQRHGLGLSRPAADGRPRYVLRVEPVTNTVVVGPREGLAVTRVRGSAAVWPEAGGAAAGDVVAVQLRAHGEPLPATVTARDGGEVEVLLADAATGVAPGQTMVLYRGSRVVGAATVASAAR